MNPKNLKRKAQTDACIPMFIATLFTTAKNGKKKPMSINRWMDKQIIHILLGYRDKMDKQMLYSHAAMLLSHENKWSSNTCYNMDEPWKHYVKWNKPETKKQVWYDSTYMKYVVFVSMNLLILSKRLTKGWGKEKIWWCVGGGVEIIMATKFLLFGVMKNPGNR